jgi:putative addiction module CopG family antidote
VVQHHHFLGKAQGTLADLDKIRHCVIFYFMANTLNISLTAEQKEWLHSRRESGGFASASDVVRDLIRTRQEQEQAQLLERFQQLDRDGSDQPEPVETVLNIVKQIKKERRG